MKTSVPMQRKMGDFIVIQRTKDSMFNATKLLKDWNKKAGMKKQMVHFLGNKQTESFIEALQKEENIKKRNDVVSVTTGTKGGTWMNPYLFIKFSMWLNPTFELQVIKFVHDQLIAFRDEAGDNYNGLTSAVMRLQGIDYRQMAKCLNWIVFNRHERDIRQSATQQQLKELTEYQKKLAFAVDMGYIRTFDELLNEMRRMWQMRWSKPIHALPSLISLTP